MRFFVKTAFWLCLIVLLLPIDRQSAGLEEGPGAVETIAALQATMQDIRGFCERNPDTCATGSANLDNFREKAAYSAELLQAWLDSDQLTSALAPDALDDMASEATVNASAQAYHDALGIFLEQIAAQPAR